VKLVAILVEGQTEEQFVDRVLQPYLNPDCRSDGVWLQPIVVTTSRTPAGSKARGGGGWKHYDRNLNVLLGQSHWFRVGLLLDYYAYPRDAPGAQAAGRGRIRHRLLVEALATEYKDARFVPGVALHEFETWVIAAAIDRPEILGERAPAQRLQAVVREFSGDVELINDGQQTAPSKRVLDAWPGYSKTIDGIDAVLDAGLDRVLMHCPALRDWVERLVAPVAWPGD
jgi:hypothetical protein